MTSWQDVGTSPADRAAALLAQMTLAEKASQLGSYWPRSHTVAEHTETGVAPMDQAFAVRELADVIENGLGHLTRNFGSGQIDPADGVERLAALQRSIQAANRFGIPAIAHEECLTGFTTYSATVYPGAIAWGATFDPNLIEQMAHRIGSDMAAVGVHQGLSPLLDVVRDYRWGRVEETLGEDPYLVGMLGTAYVTGLQRAGILATCKHFVGYSASRAGRNHAPVPMGRRELEDFMLPSFEMAVRIGHVGSVMNSYSDIDGQPVAASADLLTGVLRDRWGFTGTVVSDYFSVSFLDFMHHVAPDQAEAGLQALSAGIDIELPQTVAYEHLADLVANGRLDEATVDRAVLRVLRQKAELGLLDPQWDPDAQGAPVPLDPPENRVLARAVAEQSIVLLRNQRTLPLGEVGTVALIGPVAAEPRSFLGCYSFPNHGMADSSTSLGIEVPSLAEAMRDEYGDRLIAVETGVPFVDPDDSGIAAAVAAASAADLVVMAVGDLPGMFGKGTSGEGCDTEDLTLPGRQAELVERVLDTGASVVLVLVTGRPYSVGAFADRCQAIVQAFLPGEAGAEAVVEVLTGRINPSGKLPVGIPEHAGGQPGTYLAPPLGWYSEGVSNLDPRPRYPFGFGLSYTDFELTSSAVDTQTVDVDGTVTVSADLSNVGDRAGAEVVQLYLSDPVASVVRPVKQLIGFAKVHLEPGQAATVTFEVHADRLSFTGLDYQRIVEPGEVVLSVGTSSEDRPWRHSVMVTGQTRVVPEGRVLITGVTVDRH